MHEQESSCPLQVAVGPNWFPRHDDLLPRVAMMSPHQLIDRTAAIAAVLAELDVHHHERVLIMLPDGPGFAESFTAAVHHGALPLTVSPLLSAPELAAAAAQAGARLVLASPDQIPTMAELDTEPVILLNGPYGPWVAALRLR